MNGERIAAVLELVFDLDRLAGQLAELPHRHEAGAELMRDRAREDEAARFDAHDDVDPLPGVVGTQHVDHGAERRPVLQKRGDVLEEDPLGREILDVSDFGAKVGDLHAGAHGNGRRAEPARTLHDKGSAMQPPPRMVQAAAGPSSGYV